MARPIKNNLDFFRHEKIMRNDPKIRAARQIIGNYEGYSLYLMLLEVLCDQEDLKYPNDEKHLKILSIDFVCDADFLKKAIDVYANQLDLLQISEGYIKCDQLNRRHEDVFNDRLKYRFFKEQQKNEGLSIEKTELSTDKTEFSIEKTELPSRESIVKDSIVKNSTEKKIKEKNSNTFRVPTLSEVTEYCKERKNNIDAQYFIDHYSARGWMIGKNKVKDWKACIRTWERNEYSSGRKNDDQNDRPKLSGVPYVR